jgi:hypothetical protein
MARHLVENGSDGIVVRHDGEAPVTDREKLDLFDTVVSRSAPVQR